MPSRQITELDDREISKFFRKDRVYINFDLPPYFHFDQLLSFSSGALKGKALADLCQSKNSKLIWPSTIEGVNYTILSNKDGAYSWRPMDIIHPVLYIDFVNTISSKTNWTAIAERFKSFSDGYVECISIPRESQGTESDKASQISHWWENIEQRSIKQALEYSYILSTDITDCYGSIYTHSVEWALDPGGKKAVKARRKDGRRKKTLGTLLDEKLRGMNNGQTNGIPTGSTLMDFVAEMVLGYADLELTEAIKQKGIAKTNFRILRYRDDYRILANDPVVGHDILKLLSQVLYELGLKMHPGKTHESGDVIDASIKPEKLEVIFSAPSKQHYQKEALRIYQLSKKYPNSGLVSKELSIYYDWISRRKHLKNVDLEVLISIFTMIGVRSPKVINWVAAINSKLLEKTGNIAAQKELTQKIVQRFKRVPNAGLTEIWLQRISAPMGVNVQYQDTFTEAALSTVNNSELWNSSWLKKDVVKIINAADISELNIQLKEQTITPIISREEVELFRSSYF